MGSIFGPIRFLLPVCRLCWFLYTLNIYAHFSSHFSQQLLMAEIWYWSQASYRYLISWEAFLDTSDSYFLFADLVGFYTHWTYMHIFRHIFLSNYWWQRSDIWSQASYRYPISWEAFLNPSDSYFLFAGERGYHKWALAHSSSCSWPENMKRKRNEMLIKHNETRFTDTNQPIRIQKSPPPPPPPIHSFSLFTPQPANFKCSFTPHQDNFISMAFCPQETLFSGIALNKNWKNYLFEQSFTGLEPKDRYSSQGLIVCRRHTCILICFYFFQVMKKGVSCEVIYNFVKALLDLPLFEKVCINLYIYHF